MKSKLNVGDVLKGAKSKYTIIEMISDKGGQGGVYKAKDLNGKEWAVKWYWEFDAKQCQRIQDLYTHAYRILPIIQSNHCQFMWPKDFIRNSESFGYIMELAKYKGSFGDLVYEDDKQVDFQALAELSINLCKGFDKLHSAGYCYKDISYANIKFDLKTRAVEILDCDNVRVDMSDTSGVIGTEGFIAPEVVQGASPNKLSDRFSVSTILFCIWCRQKPFEGTAVVMYDGNDMLRDLYAHPVFIFHPKDKSNTAEKDPSGNWAKGLFDCVRARWSALPTILREKFAFSFIDALDEPRRRLTDSVWIQTFESIIKDGYLDKCSKCGKKIAIESKSCVFCGASHKPKQRVTQPEKPKHTSTVQGHTQPTALKRTVRTPQHKQNTIEIFDGDKLVKIVELKAGVSISGKDVSDKLGKIPHLFKIVSKPNSPQKLGLMNLTIYNFTMVARGLDKKGILKPNVVVALNSISKIILPSNIMAYIY